MTLTPHQKELVEMMAEVLLEDPRFYQHIERAVAKARFEKINGLCEEECTYQK